MHLFSRRLRLFPVGLAMFSMFFGAGNVVFPFVLGQLAKDKIAFGLLGLLITAVGVPFLGLFAITLFEGNWRSFFAKLGRFPAWAVIFLIMALIGPLGAIPRCITFSYSTMSHFYYGTNLMIFSLVACIVIFALTVGKKRIVDILGYVLTPVLLISLAIITIKGLLMHPENVLVSHQNASTVFLQGAMAGYHTLDLLSAFFFCSIVIESLKQHAEPHRSVFKTAIWASIIGAGTLALAYVAMAYTASLHADVLQNVAPDKFLGALSIEVLGPYAGILSSLAVTLACLTTAIALSSVFAEFLRKDVCNEKISYAKALVITLVLAFCVSTLDFDGIVAMLSPIIQVMYPSLIVFTIANIAHELYAFPYVRFCTAITFLFSLALQWV